jgi:hypothetical protein
MSWPRTGNSNQILSMPAMLLSCIITNQLFLPRDVLSVSKKLAKEREEMCKELSKLHESMIELHDKMIMEMQVMAQENASLRKNGINKEDNRYDSCEILPMIELRDRSAIVERNNANKNFNNEREVMGCQNLFEFHNVFVIIFSIDAFGVLGALLIHLFVSLCSHILLKMTTIFSSLPKFFTGLIMHLFIK